MKKIILIILSLILIFINELTLANLSPDSNLGIHYLIKIRFFNLITFLSMIIVYFYYENFLTVKITKKIFFIIFYLFTIDYVSKFVGFGYPTNEKDSIRYIFPYDWIRGEPNVVDHNEFGFRGVAPNTIRDPKKFVIGFFGGSTGYAGTPPIIELLSQKLKKNNFEILILIFHLFLQISINIFTDY